MSNESNDLHLNIGQLQPALMLVCLVAFLLTALVRLCSAMITPISGDMIPHFRTALHSGNWEKYTSNNILSQSDKFTRDEYSRLFLAHTSAISATLSFRSTSTESLKF